MQFRLLYHYQPLPPPPLLQPLTTHFEHLSSTTVIATTIATTINHYYLPTYLPASPTTNIAYYNHLHSFFSSPSLPPSTIHPSIFPSFPLSCMIRERVRTGRGRGRRGRSFKWWRGKTEREINGTCRTLDTNIHKLLVWETDET